MLSKNQFLGMILLVILLLAVSGCAAPSETSEPPGETPEETAEELPAEIRFTAEEISAFNGRDGQPAYVIYDGTVYDVSDHPQWQSGSHGGNMAGTDITDMLDSAPHGVSKLDEVPVVGAIGE